MEIVITQWALDAYLDLKHKGIFSRREFESKIKPDVSLLKYYPQAPKFNNEKFWSPANDTGGSMIAHGFKMKWHHIGNGKVQLRLLVGLLGRAYLCEGYVKSNDTVDRRMVAKFKTHIQLIQQNKYIQRGVI